jgi:hypothetical protein
MKTHITSTPSKPENTTRSGGEKQNTKKNENRTQTESEENQKPPLEEQSMNKIW